MYIIFNKQISFHASWPVVKIKMQLWLTDNGSYGLKYSKTWVNQGHLEIILSLLVSPQVITNIHYCLALAFEHLTFCSLISSVHISPSYTNGHVI